MKVLVIGLTGMLGNAVFKDFSQDSSFTTYGTVRSANGFRFFPEEMHNRILIGIDADNFDTLIRCVSEVRPDIVINCVGIVKQLASAEDPLVAIPINALFPHRLARLCAAAGARLVHISTDCVFSGKKGMYSEEDAPDAYDLYGRSKLLGEVDYENAVTLRTSIIGHELGGSAQSLICWFLSQQNGVKGFTRAFFSGLPTVELSRVIRERVIPNRALRGLHHVASAPISKYDLLKLTAERYSHNIPITPDDTFVIDRSLSAALFNQKTGYTPPGWADLIERMRAFG